MRHTNVVLALYNHPDLFPPTRNTVELLSDHFDTVHLLYRPNSKVSIGFPNNVKQVTRDKLEPASPGLIQKIGLFIQFVRKLRKLIKKHKPEVIILHDQIALFAGYLALKMSSSNAFLWYHNHDVSRLELVRKYSISWFAVKVNSRIFPKLDLMTIPSEERLSHFPTNLLRSSPMVIPNFPLIQEVTSDVKPRTLGKEIKILYQGIVTFDRGLEEILPVLKHTSAKGKQIKLGVLGKFDPAFESTFHKRIEQLGVKGQVELLGFVPYEKVKNITRQYHIGLATLTGSELNTTSAAKASNKIYEYASSGLPIIYYDVNHYRKHLSSFEWAFGSDLSAQSLKSVIDKIGDNYPELSCKAQGDFQSKLNFQSVFLPVLKQVFNEVYK